MQIIDKKEPGEKDYGTYVVKVALLVFATIVIAFALTILGYTMLS